MLRFGTDGIRGDAETDLTSDLVVALGAAAAAVFGVDLPFIVGRDTRRSGPRLRDDLAAGLHSEGAVVRDAGVLPTPGLAFLAASAGSPALMISASHNPWTDNGIKLFAPGGRKLDDAAESRIEDELRARFSERAPSRGAATLDDQSDSVLPNAEYVEHLVAAVGHRRLDGLRVVLDCANGAAYELGPSLFRTLGADVVVLHAAPDGTNINEACGSTDPTDLQAAVVAVGAHAGLAFDGDADRVLAVDELGAIVDGDQIMAIAALDMHERGVLRNDAIAVTVMSNLGLHRALRSAGIGVVETPVGDRRVFAAIEDHDLVLGGEQSGHVIFRELATTGDGILTGLVLLDRAQRAGRSLSALASVMTRVPQLLESVRVASRPDIGSAPRLAAEIAAVEAELGDRGRVLVRASGTEPVIRIMVEAPTEAGARHALDRLRRATEESFGTAAPG
ncbi:MAG: phosphoglucosamine mutase [Actinomycetota bacterium]|nr:phosphoglucosamine mutase [Actinomycetota bacterium]